MRTMASRGFRIFGSSTVSTRTLFFPCQHSAFTGPPILFVKIVFLLISRQARFRLLSDRFAIDSAQCRAFDSTSAEWLSDGGGNFAGFHQLFDMTQALPDLLLGIFALQ